MDELFTEGALFVEPARNLHGLAGRLRRTSGEPGRPPSYAGTDIIVVENGRIAALYLFFDQLPVKDVA